jgi:hypothetical protein
MATLDPKEPKFKYWDDTQQTIVCFIQELISVAFQLTCLSRLGTDEIISNLILFLTLIVFAGPYLNIYITFIHHICIKEDILWYLPKALFIMVMHLCGALIATAIVTNSSRDWSDNIVWKSRPVPNSSITGYKFDWGIEFYEEMTGVTSLLIGCAYLFWLQTHEGIQKKIEELKENNNPIPYFDINFFLRLTLLVASVSRAFPSVHLSFHISAYLLGMELISWDQFGAHVVGGLVGLLITVVLVKSRQFVYGKVPPAINSHESQGLLRTSQMKDQTIVRNGLSDPGQGTLFRQNRYTPLRVSLQGGNYL